MSEYLTISFLLISLLGSSQDLHFSEYFASALNLNPARTGMFLGDIRASISYRDQYRAVADPFQTLSIAVDRRKTNVLGRKHSLGYGGILNSEVAGDANFGMYQVGGAFAFHFYLSRRLRFSSGALLSLQTYSLNEDELRFGDQFGDYAFDSDIESGEPLDFSNPSAFNLGAGVNMRYYFTDRNLMSWGFASNNINTPVVSLYGDSQIRQPRRFSANIMGRIAAAKFADAIPMVRYTWQGANAEFQMGGQMYHYLSGWSVKAVNYGVWFRALDRDAVIWNLGFLYGMFYLGLNYDINVSELSQASNNRGAFEIHGILYFDKSKRKKKQKVVSCPGHI